jgi:hypothetical protein
LLARTISMHPLFVVFWAQTTVCLQRIAESAMRPRKKRRRGPHVAAPSHYHNFKPGPL